MAFFLPQTFYHIQAPQNPLYHLLRELDQSIQQPQRKRQCQPQQKSRAQASCPAYRVNSRPWEPRFEAHETEDSFVLYGELPGMNKEHVTVEFPEPRKLVVSGKVERFTEEPKAVETATTTTEEAAPAPATESDNEDTRSRSSYQATVEDDVDDDEFEVLSHTSEKSKTVSQPEPETLSEKAQEKQPAQPEEPKRSGYSKEFSRYFTFPTYINHDAVTADLKDGLLTIVVPKATPKSQRIIIN